ncbi:hypothetical protein GDO81_026474 [Engystomops pustulosus]|uniref:Secreted protein n=1 Tax=Engystomops pustulosus TaxID=76066 RepID=A0AAV6YZ38_ENGPU|nr:hypothetical protein GDO81_026474 [Engystomops pustulosus]
MLWCRLGYFGSSSGSSAPLCEVPVPSGCRRLTNNDVGKRLTSFCVPPKHEDPKRSRRTRGSTGDRGCTRDIRKMSTVLFLCLFFPTTGACWLYTVRL